MRRAGRRNIVISLLSTYALYLVSSLIFFDVRPARLSAREAAELTRGDPQPAHMFTSFIQYLLLSPSFTNILNVCVLCVRAFLSSGPSFEP